jgi:HEAT repeat protein
MRRWRFILVGILLLLVLVPLFTSSEREPTYNGRPLSEWLRLYARWSPSPGSPRNEEAASAIRRIGTNALPYLTKWIQYERPAWRMRLYRLMAKFPWSSNHLPRERSLERAEGAAEAFKIFGPEASPAIPELAQIINDHQVKWDSSFRAFDALVAIGNDGLPPLVEALDNPKMPTRAYIADSIRRMSDSGLDVSSAIPALLRRRDDGYNSLSVRILLDDLSEKPSAFIPALTNCLHQADVTIRLGAVEYLGRMGEKARPAVPALTAVFEDANFSMRLEATNALQKIAPETLARPL